MDEPIVNRKRIREGLEQCLEELATSFAIVKKRVEDTIALLEEEDRDDEFVVDDGDDDDVVIVNDDDDDVSDWISDADAEKTCQLAAMLENAGTNSFTDLLATEPREFRQWWQRCFQDRMDIVESGFGHDNGKRAQLLLRAIRDEILQGHATVRLGSAKGGNKDKCSMCGLSRSLNHKLKLSKTTHYIGKSCASVVQSFINFWTFLEGLVIPDENSLEEGRHAYGQLLGYMQAIEQAHENKGRK